MSFTLEDTKQGRKGFYDEAEGCPMGQALGQDREDWNTAYEYMGARCMVGRMIVLKKRNKQEAKK